MRLTILLLFITALQLHAKTEAQRISLNASDRPLKNVLTEIKQQSKFSFFWIDQYVNSAPKINVRFTNYSLPEALDAILKGLPLTYKIKGHFVYIMQAEQLSEKDIIVQQITIHGKVTDTSGMPVSAASVIIKGKNKGTFTAADGTYSVFASKGDVLQFSHIGYVTKEVVISDQEVINIQLDEQNSSLNDIVIVGYGTQQKKDVTGAIASVGQKELKQSPVANLSNALAGRLPGLVTLQNSGEPGADGSTLYIRGRGTTGDNSPLILVDGIERDFSGLDPNEVSDITILKDAASTAIYGIRGANGVILVTTRRGSNEKPSINVSLQNGWQSPTRLPEYANSYDGLKLYREGLENDGLNTTQYTDSILNFYKDRSKPAYQYLYPDVDWLHTMLKPYAYMRQGNLNVTGGNNFAKYFVSMSYLQQNGLYNFEDQIKQYDIQAVTNKYNFRSNIDLQISKDLTMELNLGAIVRDRNYPDASAGSLFDLMKETPAWEYPLMNPDGSIPAKANVGNGSPYGALVNAGYKRYFETTLQSTAGFKWDMHSLLKGLSSRVRFSFDNVNYRNVERKKDGSTYLFSIKSGMAIDTVTDLIADGEYQTIHQGSETLDYGVSANGQRRTTLELYLNYDKQFGKHSIHAVAVYNQSSFFDDVDGGQANAILGLPYKYDGIVGRISYNYNDRYLLELDGGYNGSENFAAGHRLGFFPAVSAGWVISKEKFIADNPDFKFINNLKLRGSFGVVGNDKLGGDRFLYQSTWTLTGSGYKFGQNVDGNSYSGAYETQAGDPGITWEKSKNTNVGLDLSLWNDGLSITGDYFWNHRTDLLLTSGLIPADIGLTAAPPTNGGIVNNRGYEISIEHKRNFGKQGYDIRFNFSYSKNKIVYYAEPSYAGIEWQAHTGTELGEQYGYTALGLFKDAEDIANSPTQTFGSVQPGDIKYKDLNNDGIINSSDEGYLPGKVNTPRSILGLSLSYHYASFDISVFMQAGLGGAVMMEGVGIWPFMKFTGVLKDVIDNHWVTSDPDKNWEFPRMSSQDNPNNEQPSTFWLRSSNYLRLKTCEIGYTFPEKLIKKTGFKNARVFVNGINLFTWDKVKLFDPEMESGGTGTYPQQKVINVGLSFSF